MIIFDTETTGLVQPYAKPLEMQPFIIEFAAIKLSDEAPYEEIDRIEFKCNPGFPLSDIIVKITGLTDEILKDEPAFPHYYPALVDFFLGEKYLIAHNVTFDVDLLRFALKRMDKLFAFPWPPNQLCTIVHSMSIKGYRLKQELLLEHVTGEFKKGTHRAMADVEDLETIVRWMLEKEMLPIQ